jgi:CheY-like chemotaxis protein
MKARDSIKLERLTVLMVESDVLVRRPIAEYLRDCGYRVIEAGNTDEALLILNPGEIQIDVVLADAQASGKLDGFGLSHWLRKNRPDAQVVLAGTIAHEAKEAGDLCEEGPHLAKPYEPARLVDRIKRAVAARDRAGKPGPGGSA